MRDPFEHAGFPGGDANGHVGSIPACAALDLSVHLDRGWPIDTRIGAGLPAACTADGRIDPGAALLLADQAMATGVFASLVAPIPMLTLDLRVDWLGTLPAGPLRCVIDDVTRDGDIALVRARLVSAEGPVGAVSSRYLLGAMPGGEARIDQDGAQFPVSTAATFQDYLGATQDGEVHRLDPRPDHIGARGLPAFHGGVIAAFLARTGTALAPDFRPIDIEIRYLAPARADRPLRARATPQRLGRRAATVDVAAWQDTPDRPVAIARLLAMQDAPQAVQVFPFPPAGA